MTQQRLNFAGFLAKHFITSKLTLVFIIAVALMGVVAGCRPRARKTRRSSCPLPP